MPLWILVSGWYEVVCSITLGLNDSTVLVPVGHGHCKRDRPYIVSIRFNSLDFGIRRILPRYFRPIPFPVFGFNHFVDPIGIRFKNILFVFAHLVGISF